MKKTIAVLISSVFIVSCYTQKKAINQSIKAYVHHPSEVAGLHSNWFPVQTKTVIEKEYIQGKDSLIIDTVTVDCEDVIHEDVKIVKVPVVKNHYRVDTFKHKQIDTVENTAKVTAMEGEIGVLKIEVSKLESKIESKNNKLTFFISWFGLSIIAVLFYLLTRFKIL